MVSNGRAHHISLTLMSGAALNHPCIHCVSAHLTPRPHQCVHHFTSLLNQTDRTSAKTPQVNSDHSAL